MEGGGSDNPLWPSTHNRGQMQQSNATAGALGLFGELRAVTAARSVARKAAEKAGGSGEHHLELGKPKTEGIPVRELMTQVFLHKRARSFKEFFVYFIYVAIFVAVVAQINDSSVSRP